MYNSFLAEKHEEQLVSFKNKQRKMKKWQQRYKTQVMPTLVCRFNRRMDGFVKKMEDQPVILPQNTSENKDTILLRTSDDRLNISKDKFRFKNSLDWRSLYPPIERAQRQEVLKEYKKKNMDSTMAFRNIFSQSKYQPFRHQYRSRDRNKQVNPAMRYATKNTSATLQILPKVKKDLKKSVSVDHKVYSNVESNSEKKEDEGLSNSNEGRNSSLDYLLLNMSSVRKIPKVVQKSEQQIRQEEQLKLLAQNRLYFKSLQNIEMKMEKNGQKTALKNLLQKCGVKKRSPQKYNKEQVDGLMEFMSKTQVITKMI